MKIIIKTRINNGLILGIITYRAKYMLESVDCRTRYWISIVDFYSQNPVKFITKLP